MQTFIADKLNRKIKDLRISVTDRCNFRCPYCMPVDPNKCGEAKYSFLPRNEILTFEEITRIARLFVDLGVTKIKLTGGEPLIRKDIEELVSCLCGIDGLNDLALTTNGYLLPGKAAALKDSGLQRITVSLDSLDEKVFGQMNGKEFSIGQILKGIKKTEATGFNQIKINTVVKKGLNDHTMLDLAQYFRGTGDIVRFIEYMDVGNLNDWDLEYVVSADEIFAKIDTVFPLEPLEPNYDGEVATRYRYRDGGGEIGIIASVTKPFCGGCTRIRLSTDGKLYTCLFASQGIDLRDRLRAGAGDEDLKNIIINTWKNRDDRYSELRTHATRLKSPHKKIEMYQIGG